MTNAPPTACALIIGNEILSGRTEDANLAFLGRRCDELGIRLLEARVIPDIEQVIVSHVNACRREFNYVFTTGGIGPTHDDITATSIARAFNVDLELNQSAVDAMNRYYDAGKLNEARLRMAHIPIGATLIDNPVSGAPGFQLDNVFVLPGVPSIMHVMFDGITDRLVGGAPILTESVTTDLTESRLARELGAIQQRNADIAIGSYPFFSRGRLGVNLVLRGIDPERLAGATAEVREMVARLGGCVVNV